MKEKRTVADFLFSARIALEPDNVNTIITILKKKE
jgi:hypothetical protein